jgi:hypothetical protein
VKGGTNFEKELFFTEGNEGNEGGFQLLFFVIFGWLLENDFVHLVLGKLSRLKN